MFPDMSDALAGWESAAKLQYVRPAVNDFEAGTAAAVPVAFDGVVLPMKTSRLMIKPEGQRAWNWRQLITTENLRFGDIVIVEDGLQMKVMSIENYGGHKEYELAQVPA